MLLSYGWLKTYLPKLPPPTKLVETLMMHGLDVEGVTTGNSFERVVVGEIVGIKPHPNADKLRIAEVVVDRGSSSARQEIVCGAPNIAVGQKVPVALLGAKLPNGLTIESRPIRGVVSNGMLCAEDELGLGTSHDGIMILDAGVKVGMPFADAIGAGDTVIDLAIPANRADLMSLRGLAWEIGAMLKQTAKLPPPPNPSSGRRGRQPLDKESINLKIADAKLCALLTARVIRGAHLAPTPRWLAQRLQASGMRSVNIIADITNYIMLEYGQPLHAYDAAKIQGQTITSRPAHHGETLVTIDRHRRHLYPSMLVIADESGPIALAGVMGGQATEVSDTTTDIILEAAIFNPVAIRKTSRRLGLVSEASKRFEKGLWPALTEQASAAAAAMIAELCGGTVEKGPVTVGAATVKPATITMKPSYISERLGAKISAAKCKTILTKLGFKVKGTIASWTITVPDWRLDVSIPEDIVDEVGRMIGYDELPKQTTSGIPKIKELPRAIRFKEEVKNILVDMGFTEVISHAFYSLSWTDLGAAAHYEIANPLDKTQQFLRTSLVPQLTEFLKREADAGQDAYVFEIGRIFDPSLLGEITQQQPWKLAIGIVQKPSGSVRPIDICTKEMLNKIEISDAKINLDYLQTAAIRGRVVYHTEIDLAKLMKVSKKVFGPWDPERHIVHDVKAHEQSKYPAVTRDIAFWWPKSEAEIAAAISDVKNDLLKQFTVTDRFTKNGKTSYKISCRYQSDERTLTKAEVDSIEINIKDALINLGAEIR